MRAPVSLWNRWLWILLLAGLWLGLQLGGFLVALEQWSLGWRFRCRGPLESEAKVYYVNRDAAASREFGMVWFPREYYALAGEALLGLGQARALFLDFVLTSDHLPPGEAERLTYAGNVALQRFLLTHPDRVVLAAAYGGKRYPFSEYASILPDRLEGDFVVAGGGARGYAPRMNPLPDLPEFPLWCPPIELEEFPFPGIGEVGLINTSPSLNRGQQVLWLPALVEVENPFLGLFLVNGMQRWAETVAWHQGLPGGYRAEAGEGRLLVRGPEGAIVKSVPRALSKTFHSAALKLWELQHPGARWVSEGNSLVLRTADGASLRALPLQAGQHLAVNWFSPWHTGDPRLHARVEALAREEAEEGHANWDVLAIGRDPRGWIEAVEAGDPRAIEPIRPWGLPNDPFNPQVSIADVLFLYDAYLQAGELGAQRTRDFIAELFGQFADAFILIGPTDPLLQDLAPTPFDPSPVPKVSVHGNLLKMLAEDRPLRFAGPWEGAVWTMGLALAVGFGATRGGTRYWVLLLASLGLLLGYAAASHLLFGMADRVLPMAAPLGAGLTAGVYGIGRRLWEEERQKARIRSIFGTYVSPEVVNLMVDSHEEPQLGGHVREVTAFFSDIEAFSSIAEQLPADVLVELMNEYLDTMTGVVTAERGTLDKYIGDAIVAIFGAPHALPDHAARACLAAAGMQAAQAGLRHLWAMPGATWPEGVRRMRTRIGLHTGEAVVGNMGSKQRFTYTMMGDSVNLAARLEQLGKAYGADVLVSEPTREAALVHAPHLVFRFLDLVAVKGRRQPVRVYELLGTSEHLKPAQLECVACYEAAMEAYLRRDWAEAARLFARAGEAEDRRGEKIHPSGVMEIRCRLYASHPPPEDWDGVFVMTRKG
jgi:class 3 adenylate cyclase